MEFPFNKNAGYYYKSSKELFLPVEILNHIEGFLFKLGRHKYIFRNLETSLNNGCSQTLAHNKYCTNKLLEHAGVPVPKATWIDNDKFKQGQLETIIADLTFPLVAKPNYGTMGLDVICNIPDIEQLKTQLRQLFTKTDWMSIEEFHGGLNSYRILVLNQQIIGVIQRYAAHVVGDGEHTLTELISLANSTRKQANNELAPIVIDDECRFRLKELGMTPHSIPEKNERVVLCYTCNASRGGSYEAIPIDMCKQNKNLFLKVTSILNLNIAGIDVECVDLHTPIENGRGVIIEVNPNPSVRIHEAPQYGKPNPVTKKIIRSIIVRHPLSYLYVLYKNKRTAMYVRILMTMPFLIGFYILLAHEFSVFWAT